MLSAVLSWADALGWVGGIVAAATYVLVARGYVAPDSARFHAANAGAAALLAVAALSRDALPSAVLNLVWIVFGGLSLAAALRRRAGRPAGPERRTAVRGLPRRRGVLQGRV